MTLTLTDQARAAKQSLADAQSDVVERSARYRELVTSLVGEIGATAASVALGISRQQVYRLIRENANGAAAHTQAHDQEETL